ncbi:hypothetical protein [Mycobacterium interjectum]|uniref:hypothetical protein n=1 Tax=Mycobacterium interjectum TaxID=33895 RepID=UPI0021F2E5E5|nr:hypothetical protein [Mycobacterium interjectum]
MSSPRSARQLIGVTGAVALIAATAMTAACTAKGTNNPGAAGTTATAPTAATATSATTGPTRSGQSSPSTGQPSTGPATGSAVVLPFTGLDRPVDVTVAPGTGAVFVTDGGNNRVVKMAANSATQSVPPFTGLNNPVGVAANGDDIFVSDASNARMLWANTPRTTPSAPWQSASNAEWVGPFTGLNSPRGVFLVMGSVFYVVDSGNNRVLMWREGINAPQVLGFTGLSNPDSIAVDDFSNVFVSDTGNNRVMLLKGDGTQSALAFTGLNSPQGVAVYSGDVYVATGVTTGW